MANAILAAILSFLIPGLGQAYAGDMKKGIIFFIVFLIIIGLYMLSWINTCLSISLNWFSVFMLLTMDIKWQKYRNLVSGSFIL